MCVIGGVKIVFSSPGSSYPVPLRGVGKGCEDVLRREESQQNTGPFCIVCGYRSTCPTHIVHRVTHVSETSNSCYKIQMTFSCRLKKRRRWFNKVENENRIAKTFSKMFVSLLNIKKLTPEPSRSCWRSQWRPKCRPALRWWWIA